LSEAAALGFEYGYNIQAPERLVLWEAQYGDFINGAQVIVDEFITTARAKWGQNPSLVLLLPHGHEGAGPDHSSGRLERFLQLTGENNMRIANCTTAAQYFHLLRRQAILLKTDPLPLIVMTPKSLLRHPLVASTLREVAEGQWQPVIDDMREPSEIRRLFLCSGKIYIDLISSDYREQNPEVAIIRVEQLYPFPEVDLKTALDRYPNLEEVIWVQEEPENMGAWWFMQSRLGRLIAGRWPLRYVGRTTSSSPAEGSSAWFTANQSQLIQQAFDPGPDHIQDDFIIS
jgi:2-oxoglutarate dehydrogenase E1 component